MRTHYLSERAGALHGPIGFRGRQIMFGTAIPLREDIELQLRDIEALGVSAV